MELMHSLLNYSLQQRRPCSCSCSIISKGAVLNPSLSKSAARNHSSGLGLQFPFKRQAAAPLQSCRYALHLGLHKQMPRGCSDRKTGRKGRLCLSRRLMSSEAEVAPAADVDELKEQLEALEEEAQQAMGRANNARARFMRLTDVVEQLRLRAALDVKFGNEDSARLLLQEKKNVMRALELSKKRAEMLEEFCSKLREAISKKESELIAALSCARLDMDAEANDLSRNVRVVSPKYSDSPSANEFVEQDLTKNGSDATGASPGDGIEEKGGTYAGEESHEYFQKDLVFDHVVDTNGLNCQIGSLEESMHNEERTLLDRGVSYKAFMLDIDDKIAAIEGKLRQFMDVAGILVESGGTKVINERVQTVRLLLQHVQEIRTRIFETIGSSPSCRE